MDDIAYTLSKDRLSNPQDHHDVSKYIILYCAFGYLLLMTFVMHHCCIMLSNNNIIKFLKTMSLTILDHFYVIMSAMFIGYLFIICEFIATAVYFRFQDFYYCVFHMCLWFPSLCCFLIILFMVMILCCYKKCNWEKSDGLVLLIVIFTMGVLMFFIYIYCYALPTFLLLLVYPTKIITIVAYLITFIFVTVMVSSIAIRLFILESSRKFSCCLCIMIIIDIIFVLVQPLIMFLLVIQFLYLLVLGKASAISTGPYTVLSLIPTAAISAASWLVKNKVFSSVDEKEDKEEHNQENDKSATNDDEALTLVVNEGSPINGNNQEVKSYGTADNDN